MKRRGFFGALGGLIAAPAAAVIVSKQVQGELMAAVEPAADKPLAREMHESYLSMTCATVGFNPRSAAWEPSEGYDERNNIVRCAHCGTRGFADYTHCDSCGAPT